jgi:hypothetical protein
VVVLIPAGDVRRQIHRQGLARRGEALRHPERQQLGDVRGGDRRDRPDGDIAEGVEGGVAEGCEVVDDDVGHLK